MTGNQPMSFIHQQVMWDRLTAVVEEQAQTLVRTGFSTSTREAGDVSAGVFDVAGRMLAQAVTGTPGHVNSMARSVYHFIDKFPTRTMRPGDVFITNDPWKGTGHLHDFTVVTPVFRRGRLAALFASTSHVVDIGGRGMSPDGRQVYEEGIFIPLMRFAGAAGVDQTLIEILRANVREPVQVIGDLYSLAACNDVGGRRLLQMMDEFEIETLDRLGDHILERSRAAMLEAVRALPPGTYRNRMRIDGYDKPIDLVAAMTIGESGIHVDFTGTSAPSAFGINVPLCYTEAYSAFGIKCIVAPKVPNNEGTLSVMSFSVPENCILDTRHPLPVATRHVTGQMLPDLMIGCLSGALGGAVPAEGTSCLWNLFAMGGAGRVDGDPAALADAVAFNVMSFHSGGAGARPGKDGLSATAFPSGVRNMPVEVSEALSPLLVRQKEYRIDSGGAGEFRGGLGQVMEVASLDDAPFAIGANYDRIDFPPRGREGGWDGMAGNLRLGSGERLRGKGQQTIPKGGTLFIEMPGGGGLGDPRRRDPARVIEDVRLGMVSREAAAAEYGVILSADLALDVEATARARSGG
ncbi:MAG TPA: hydantoinase B/oxoprolinase family protein [Stellaceae bacterium]|nr:hydantoinase B/oxoprolinase family protein [Stellaceae bacterium]